MFFYAFEFWQVVSALVVDHSGSRVLSGSDDYTVRMYDFQGMNARLQSFRQLEPSEGHQIYDRDGLTLGEFVRGDMYIHDLKNTKGHISGLTCGEWHPKTKETILTSSEDGSLYLWDVNDFKSQKQVIKPKLARPGRVPVTTCAWDREGKSIAGGVGDGSIQIFATVGDKHEGGTHILYDPTLNERGALVCVARAPRKKSVDDFQAEPVIHNPHALPLFRDQPSRTRQRDKVLKDPLKSHKPEQPITGPGFGGKIGSTKGSLLTQYLLKQGGLIKETWMEEDPREAILKHADASAKDPKFIAPAYADTQPETLFAESDAEKEDK
ncbi:hypothetical protein K7X08_020395 [Anisodus acutangulus]|uniref:Transducin/WD40 repeat-like superfamily protein n=1 Tax=Anisodus acutangulus TaxID=402998 RepID=A0A9Q1M8L1_9SOLA|nr:hypothetical protein K7X08_020395 [Anisodus acutangulus]